MELCLKLWTLKISQLHVDRRKCCQLRWTLRVINWRQSMGPVYHI